MAGQLLRKTLVQEATEFFMISRLGQVVQQGVEPGTLDLPVDPEHCPHDLSLPIATNGTRTSSSAMPPWATIRSPTSVNALRSPASKTCLPGGQPYPGHRIDSGNFKATSSRKSSWS